MWYQVHGSSWWLHREHGDLKQENSSRLENISKYHILQANGRDGKGQMLEVNVYMVM